MSETAQRGVLPEEWRVQLPVFEGPLDLLLHLVRIAEVDIRDIPIAKICDQFQAYLELMEETDLDVAGEYIYEAALLIHLKSRMVLPREVEGVSTSEDPRQVLVERLLEYQRFKEAAQSLAEIHSLRQGVWQRQAKDLGALGRDDEAGVELEEVSLHDLVGALRETLERYRREHPPSHVVHAETFSVRDQIRRLLGLVGRRHAFDLVEDLRERSCRAEAIATFLAVLELLRLGAVRLSLAANESGALFLYRTKRELEADELEAVG